MLKKTVLAVRAALFSSVCSYGVIIISWNVPYVSKYTTTAGKIFAHLPAITRIGYDFAVDVGADDYYDHGRWYDIPLTGIVPELATIALLALGGVVFQN